jgi:hypothetical protein
MNVVRIRQTRDRYRDYAFTGHEHVGGPPPEALAADDCMRGSRLRALDVPISRPTSLDLHDLTKCHAPSA